MKREGLQKSIPIGAALLTLCSVTATTVWAQEDNTPSGYHVGEGAKTPAPTPAPAETPAPTASATTADAGPVRMARFSYLQGNVTWRPDDSSAWSAATVNLPIRQGAQIWVSGGGRAEIQFDDGSIMRLGTGAVVTLQTLYSDSNGEFTEVRLNQGLLALHLLHDVSIFQVDAAHLSAKAAGPAKLRMGVDDDTEVAVREGSATIEGDQGKVAMKSGDYLDVTDASSPFQLAALPPGDSWDQFNDQRDQLMNNPARYAENCPPNVALVAGDLDDYGSWRTDPEYGRVWCPRVTEADWAPYHYGHWVWVSPFGWTWVSSEAWGWAPYHYGTWFHASYGWAWCPGPAVQYWSPGVVHFTSYNGCVAWVPLAPREVRYPAVIGIGYHRNNWTFTFSIGGAACYYPDSHAYFEPRPWHNYEVNHVTHITNVHVTNINITNVNIHNNVVPFNARHGYGVTQVRDGGFGGSGSDHYSYVPHGSGASVFEHGHTTIAEGHSGRPPFSGPGDVRPTGTSYTPTHTFPSGTSTGAPGQGVLSRPVYQGPVPPSIANNGGHSGGTVTGTTAAGSVGGGLNNNSVINHHSTSIVRPQIGPGPGFAKDGNSELISSNINRSATPDSPSAAAARARQSLGMGGGNGARPFIYDHNQQGGGGRTGGFDRGGSDNRGGYNGGGGYERSGGERSGGERSGGYDRGGGDRGGDRGGQMSRPQMPSYRSNESHDYRTQRGGDGGGRPSYSGGGDRGRSGGGGDHGGGGGGRSSSGGDHSGGSDHGGSDHGGRH